MSNKMTRDGELRIIFAGVLALASVCSAETYYLQKSGLGLTSNEVWATSSGVECSEISSSDKYICEGKCLTFKIDAKTGGTFPGGSLVIGSADEMGAGLISQKKGAALDFPDYGTVECGGLVLKNGVLATSDAGGRYDILKGKITVEATSAAPFMIVDKRGYYSSGGGWSIIEINADLHGAAGSAIEFGSVFQGDVDGLVDGNKTTQTNTTLHLKGTFNNFYGTLTVTNRHQTASTDVLGNLSSYGSKLKLDTDSVFSGRIVVNGGNVLECTTAGKEYSIGGLEMRPGSMLVLNGSTVLDSRKVPSSTSCALLRVAGECQITGPVMVAMPGCSVAADGMTNRVAILAVDSSVELDPDDFVLAGCGSSYVPSRFVVESGADGSKTLFCEFEPYAMLIASDNTSEKKGNYSSAITNGASWSTGVAQAEHVNYVVAKLNNSNMTLRSLKVKEGDAHVSEFSGKRLIISTGCKLIPDCDVFKSARNPLRIQDDGRIVGVQYGDVKFIGGVDLHHGNAMVYMYTNEFEIDGLTGSGTLKAGCGESSNNSRHFGGGYLLRDTEEFTGMLLLQQSTTPKAGMFQSLYVCGNELGGELPEFNPSALHLTDQSALRVDPSSPTQRLENVVNRGVLIDGEGRVLLANEYDRLRIDWPVSMNGELWKEGPGTLVLGGECLFGATGAADPTEDTVADILLKEGVLAIASASAIDGCRLSISNNTTLAVAYSSDNNALLKYGLRNVKTSEPFELCDVEGGKLPLAVDFSGWGGALPTALEVGLVTVDNKEEIVASVSSMMPETVDVLGVESFYKVKMSKAVNSGEDTVTFKATLTKVGFIMTIR